MASKYNVVRYRERPKVVSLFTGCGGSDAGLIDANYEIVFANDLSPYAKDLYHANLPNIEYRCEDVAKIKTFPAADLLVGCYPCQGFSQGGARISGRKINYLYRQFDRALRQIKPRAFVVENVSGMQRSDFIHLLNNQIIRFRMAGYSVDYRILNAANYGVPQQRRRIFIVGIRSDLDFQYSFPAPIQTGESEAKFATVKDALQGMPTWPTGEFLEEKFHWYYMSRNRRCEWTEPSKTIVSNARHMPLHPISPRLRKIGTDKWDWATDGEPRRFSYREAARLQGFRHDWEFPDTGSIQEKYKAIGNAVPPPLFMHIGESLKGLW